MEIIGEYWIIEGTAEYADGDRGDKNHEMFAYEYIAEQYKESIYNLAKSLNIKLPNLISIENEDLSNFINNLLKDIKNKLFQEKDPKNSNLPLFKNDNEIIEEIKKRTQIEKEALQILMQGIFFGASLDPRLYVMKKYGWMLVRNNNIETYGLSQTNIKNLISGLDDVLETEGADETILDSEVEFNLFDHKTKKSVDLTLEDIKNKNLFRPQQTPSTTYNTPVPIITGKKYGREIWRGTSENYVLKENPDNFRINGTYVSYTRSDAISFLAFEGGFFVYSNAGVEGNSKDNYGHVALAEAWDLKVNKVERFGEQSLSKGEKKLWEFYKDKIYTHGNPTPESEKLLERFYDNYYAIYDYSANPKMLKGRIWTGMGMKEEDPSIDDGEEPWADPGNYEGPKSDKVICFWNRLGDIKNMSNLAVKMIELIGENPKEYNYETERDKYVSYYEFLDIEEDKTDYNKKYQVGGSIYTYADFEQLRTEMHTNPSKAKRAKEVLCRIMTNEFINKNPELRGFIPPNCGELSLDDKELYRKSKMDAWYNYVKPEVERGLENKSVVQEPGHAAGMRGSALGGFRSKTQKEIDDAWDDFMKKRENVNPIKISFKEWLLFLEK